MAQTTTITLKAIHCESCEHTIATVLSEMGGVLRVSPSAETNQVKVSYDELALSEGHLLARLVEIGYEPVP